MWDGTDTNTSNDSLRKVIFTSRNDYLNNKSPREARESIYKALDEAPNGATLILSNKNSYDGFSRSCCYQESNTELHKQGDEWTAITYTRYTDSNGVKQDVVVTSPSIISERQIVDLVTVQQAMPVERNRFKAHEAVPDNLAEASNNYELPAKRFNKTLNRPPIDQYFSEITNSKEAAEEFIKNNMAAYTKERGYTPSTSYYVAMSKATSLANMNVLKLDVEYNYAAFIAAIAKLGITKDAVWYLWDPSPRNRPGRPRDPNKATQVKNQPIDLPNAEEVFIEKTSSLEAVKAFMCELGRYPNQPSLSRERQKYVATYSKWFVDNTTAKYVGHSGFDIKPESVCWRNFVQTCNEKFNLTARDLTKLFREA